MLVRVVIITLLLGLATLSEFMGVALLPEKSLPSYYAVVALTYGFSFIYLILLHRSKNITFNLFIQAICDTFLVTYMVYVTGGTGSIYSVFYTLVIIYSVLFLGRKGGIIIASACSIFYGALLDLEYYGVIVPFFVSVDGYPFTSGYVFSRIFTHIFSFYFIAFLTSVLVEQERKARSMLAEKEDAFEQLDVLHRSIVESVNHGILTINLLGKIKSFNRAAQHITDYSFEDVENKSIASFFPLLGDVVARGTKKQHPLEQNRFEMAFKTKNERELMLGCSLSPLRNNRGERIGDILIFQDLTSIKKMEEDFEKSRRMAFIGEMAAHLAHEIRNPLVSISGSIQVLSRDLRLSEGDKKLMRIILRGKEQLEGFMKDFLLLARPKLGAHEMVDIGETIENVLEALKYVPDWHEGIEVNKSIVEKAAIYANRSEIRQLAWNLLLNAIQAMPEKGILSIETKRKVADDASCLEIVVSDNGCGIPQNALKKIFERFYTTRDRGTGLGLAVVNRIVETHKGRIEIQSEAGKGTRCTLLLPLTDENSVNQSSSHLKEMAFS